MNDEQLILKRDLAIMEQMASEMEDYLDSNGTHWTMAAPDMPRLTTGGFLMRQHRLTELRTRFAPEDQERLDAAIEQFNETLVERVVRFEQQAHQEVHARLGEWSGYLRNLTSKAVAKMKHYSTVVDTRIVITATVEKLKEPPYQLEQQVVTEMNTLDHYLRNRWQPGAFVLDEVWQPAYPAGAYWWLYGLPKVFGDPPA